MEPTPESAPQQSTNPIPTPEARRGRRRFLNDVKCQEVCALVTAGCGIDGAARHVGCVPKTILREARRNPRFGFALQQAQMTAELNPLNAMRSAATRHWRAAAWLLERTNPQRFARLSIETIRPDQLQLFVQQMSLEIALEIPVQDTRNYMLGRFRFLVEQLHRDAWLQTRYRHVKPESRPWVPPRRTPSSTSQGFQHDVHCKDAHIRP